MNATLPRRRFAFALSIASIGLAACATMPDTDYPPSRDFELIATYLHDAQSPLQVPSSTRDRTIYELTIEPRLDWRERYTRDGIRHFELREAVEPHADTPRIATTSVSTPREIRVRCRGRLYGSRRGSSVEFVPLEQLFPGARRIELHGPLGPTVDRP